MADGARRSEGAGRAVKLVRLAVASLLLVAGIAVCWAAVRTY